MSKRPSITQKETQEEKQQQLKQNEIKKLYQREQQQNQLKEDQKTQEQIKYQKKKSQVPVKQNQDNNEKQDINKKMITQKNLQREKDFAKKFFKEVQNNNKKYIHNFIKLFLKSPIDMQKRFNFGLQEKSGFGLEHYAAWYNNIELLEFLIYDCNNLVNLDRKNKENITPLMMAALSGSNETAQILSNFVNINSQDIQGNTALHYAVIKRNIQIAEILINHNDIQINKKNSNDQTPQELIFFGEQINLQIREVLIKLFDDTINKGPCIKTNNKNNSNFNVSTKDQTISPSNSKQSLRLKVSDFKFIQEIGSGTFGKVFLVQKIHSNLFYAMKVLQKKCSSKLKYKRQAFTERNVLCSIDHPFIGKLKYAFQTDNFLYLVMDYYPGGSLREYIGRVIRVKEKLAKQFAAELILAIEELHKQNIVFRDLKPENIMIDANGHLKLIDFGLSKEGISNYDGGGQSFCGSLNYLSPEMVLKKGYGKAIDWYSLGVVVHELLTGAPYCYCNKDEGILFKIQFSKPEYPSFLNEVTIDFLDRLLEKNPKKRLGSNYGVMEIKQHPWFSAVDWDDVLNCKLIMPEPFITEINFQNSTSHYKYLQDTFHQFSQNKFNGWSFHGDIKQFFNDIYNLFLKIYIYQKYFIK